MKRFLMFLAVAGTLCADEIRIQDGTVLKGTIQSVSETQIKIETGFAGVLTVPRDKIAGFSTENPVFVRLSDGAVIPGRLTSSTDGDIEITGSSDSLSTPMSAIVQGWVAPDQDPVLLAEKKAADELQRKWRYKTVARLSGKSGNTEEKQIGGEVSAVLASKNDELKLYGSYDQKQTNGKNTTDERKVGMRYTSYFNDPWGWYVRQEFEDDKFENIKLRSVSGLGISYRFLDKQRNKLSVNAGLSYRHETYENGDPADANMGLDLGLQHLFGMDRRFEMNNEFSLVPSIEDFANYLLIQDSYIDFPLGESRFWKVRLGLRNDYNSEPAAGRKQLDTRYYSSLVAEWD